MKLGRAYPWHTLSLITLVLGFLAIGLGSVRRPYLAVGILSVVVGVWSFGVAIVRLATDVRRSLRAQRADALLAHGLRALQLLAMMLAVPAVMTRWRALWVAAALTAFLWFGLSDGLALRDWQKGPERSVSATLRVLTLLAGASLSLGMAVTGPSGRMANAMYDAFVVVCIIALIQSTARTNSPRIGTDQALAPDERRD